MVVEADIETRYISAATNRYPFAAACISSLVAFGSSTCVALWNTEDVHGRGIFELLPGHEGAITCVRFRNDSAIVSCDDRGVLKLWRITESQYRESLTRSTHKSAVSALAVYDHLIVTGSSDAEIKVWHSSVVNSLDILDEVQTIPLRGKYPVSLAVTSLPKSKALILAVGSTDRTIQIFTRSEDKFVSSVSLSGHEDWVKALDFRDVKPEEECLVLASGSQDATIRLWNIEPYKKQGEETVEVDGNTLSDELLDAFEQSLGELDEADEGGRQISLKRHIMTVRDESGSQIQFTITFDALLVGHEAGITSLCWRPTMPNSEPTLLSTSTDSSLILWSPSTILGASQVGSTSLWINRQRFGDVGGQRLGGFVGGLWSHDGAEALAWGWSGGWRRWTCHKPDETISSLQSKAENWTEIGAISGHSSAVRGLAWSPNGEYLASTGIDQTTRIHGEVRNNVPHDLAVWHEISRPQVHGYDLLRIAFLNSSKFISIADEKVARVFEAPREFLEVVQNLGITKAHADLHERPRAAVVPPLGLSNKAVNDSSLQEDLPQNSLHLTERRPFEGELAAVTLWPEVEKIFGHGYESISLAVSSSRTLAATACKATSAEHAVVRIYDTNNWQPIGQPLAGHTLTVTGIAFSPDDQFVLTVSRDRTWRLFQRSGSDGFVPVAADKSHARIIWDCCWTCEGDAFITASRDKSVRIWSISNVGTNGKWTHDASIKLSEAATAVACSPKDCTGKRHLAVGLESGEIHIFANEAASEDWKEEMIIPSRIAHVREVHQLAWRPQANCPMLQLASCSEDGTLKVLVVHTEQGE